MATFREQVVTRIRMLLAERGMTVSELARQLGGDQRNWARRIPMRAGTPVSKALDTDDLEQIARVLGVDVVDLLPRQTAVSGAGSGDPTPRYRPDDQDPDKPNSTYFSRLTERTAPDQPKVVTPLIGRSGEVSRPPSGPQATKTTRATGPDPRRPRVNRRLMGARP